MKKYFKTLLIAAMGIFALSSCEDVPAPYDVPGSGDGGSVIEQPDPAGTGSVSDPYNVAAILDVAAGLGTGETAGPYYIKGIVSSIKEVSASFGNATFYISDTGGTNNTFYVYRALGLDNKNVTSDDLIKVGDEVVICGKITNYNGTLETVQKEAYIYSINGGGGNGGSEEIATSKENPYSVAEAQGASGSNYVCGYIVGYIDGQSLENGARFEVPSVPETEILIADNPDEVDPSKVYPVQLPAGDIRNALELSAHHELLKQEVLLFGSIERYFNVPGMKSTSWARVGEKEYGKDPEAEEVPGAEPTGDGTLESPFNVAAAVKYTTALGADVESTEAVYVKGKIKTITTTQAAIDNYGNHTFTMVDVMESSETFMAFQVYAPGNVKFTSLDQIKVGDEVVVYGKVVNYKGNTPETVGKGQAYVYSINGSTEGGGEEGGGDNPGGDKPSGEASGTGVASDPYNVAGALAYISTLSSEDKPEALVYTKGYVSQVVKLGTKGSIQFHMSDKGVENSLLVYYCNNLGNVAFSSLDDLKVGDEVVVCGKVVNYMGNTPEYASGAYLVSLNGKTEGGEGGDEGGEEGGGDTPVEPLEGFTFTSSQVFGSGLNGATLATNGYGQQAIANESTWYHFSINGVEFMGCRIGIATSSNGGGLQMQGNASDAAKQGFLTNVTPFKPIKTIQMVCRTVSSNPNDPNFHLYAGTETHPVGNAIEGSVSKDADGNFNVYTYTFDLSGGDYTHFTIANDLVGVLYIDKVVVATK